MIPIYNGTLDQKIRKMSHIRYCSDMSVIAIKPQKQKTGKTGLFVLHFLSIIRINLYICTPIFREVICLDGGIGRRASFRD